MPYQWQQDNSVPRCTSGNQDCINYSTMKVQYVLCNHWHI